MFSRFRRRLTGDEASTSHVANGQVPSGVKTLDATLQRRFAKGVQYNSYVVLKF